MSPVLDGVKVIDVAINYAGPTTSMYLADQGADVIKIERRLTGDTARRSGNTPFLKLNSRPFMAINRGKRSITLDITKPDGQEIVRTEAGRCEEEEARAERGQGHREKPRTASPEPRRDDDTRCEDHERVCRPDGAHEELQGDRDGHGDDRDHVAERAPHRPKHRAAQG